MRVLLVSLAVATTAMAGCAKTQLITEPGARIYVDGQLVGRGRAEIRRSGMPTSVLVEVKTEDGRRKEVVLKRSFTVGTLAVGALTYGIGLLAYWQHPAGVQINMPEQTRSGWGRESTAKGDPWMASPRSRWDTGSTGSPATTPSRWSQQSNRQK